MIATASMSAKAKAGLDRFGLRLRDVPIEIFDMVVTMGNDETLSLNYGINSLKDPAAK